MELQEVPTQPVTEYPLPPDHRLCVVKIDFQQQSDLFLATFDDFAGRYFHVCYNLICRSKTLRVSYFARDGKSCERQPESLECNRRETISTIRQCDENTLFQIPLPTSRPNFGPRESLCASRCLVSSLNLQISWYCSISVIFFFEIH